MGSGQDGVSFLKLVLGMSVSGLGVGISTTLTPTTSTGTTTLLSARCSAPDGIRNASTPACLQGGIISQDDVCTPVCRHGFAPSDPSLNCSFQALQPPDFVCEDVCSDQGAKLPPLAGPPAARSARSGADRRPPADRRLPAGQPDL
mmetsp:Transcript_21777/g.67992  ORF Transcript_21777/g.67992 Transcript_21777/m.67992 type:complete len:146 (-) Transcript_21777:122-559(-)